MANRNSRGGKREDLSGQYFRSAWEANYARYLTWLVLYKQIKKWEYEAETFEFPVKRGSKFYTPDFRVTENDDAVKFHEVKGWMDPTSRTKLERMARHYPHIPIILIDPPAYYAIAKKVKRLVPNWE